MLTGKKGGKINLQANNDSAKPVEARLAMEFEYGLDEKPPLLATALQALTWLAVSIPSIIIIGKIVGVLHFTEVPDRIIYLQKMTFVVGATLFVQILFGHRLPIIAGPATVLLIGVIASSGFPPGEIYLSIMIGGACLACASVFGLFGYVRRLFTPRVIAVVLLLIALTLIPTVTNLIVGHGVNMHPAGNILFATMLVLAMFFSQKFLKGVWQSTIIIWGMLAGSLFYYIFTRGPHGNSLLADTPLIWPFFKDFTTSFTVNPGVALSFLFCFLALSINDLGSIEALEELLKPEEMKKRVNRGLTFTGLANILAGFFGIVGPVNYSLSPGIILSTRCASRFTLLPAAGVLVVMSFFPLSIVVIGSVPSVVIGSVLAYILTFQIAAGLTVAFRTPGGMELQSGLVIGLPLIFGTMVACLTKETLAAFPVSIQPVIGNGFVVGVLTAFILEHIVFRRKEG